MTHLDDLGPRVVPDPRPVHPLVPWALTILAVIALVLAGLVVEGVATVLDHLLKGVQPW